MGLGSPAPSVGRGRDEMGVVSRSMNMVGKFAVVGVIAAAGLLVGGCKSDSTPTTKTKTTTTQSSAASPAASDSGKVIPVNTMCPVGKHSFDATSRTAENTR